MNKDVKTLWTTALRSGEYAQTQKILRDDNGFCCLGVLCDVYLKEAKDSEAHWSDVWNFITVEGNKTTQNCIVLPSVVKKWAGLNDLNPIIQDKPLSEYNDDKGYDFLAIAELIEKQL